jgi:putative ABC transport system permease protein
MVEGVPLRVVGVFQGFGDTEPRLVMDADGLAALGIAPAYDRLSIARAGASATADGDVAAGGDPTTLDALSAALTDRFPTLEVTDRATLRSRAFEVFDRTFAMTRALTLLALLVAGVGVYNALMALRLAQAPTRRLLEAQGVAARELGRVTLIRSATIGLLAVGVALPLGIAMAWLLCRVVNPRAFGWTIELHLVPAAWLTPLALGLVATVLAGMLPAPRERGGLDESG